MALVERHHIQLHLRLNGLSAVVMTENIRTQQILYNHHGESQELNLDYVVVSDDMHYCFHLPAGIVPHGVRDALDNGPRHECDAFQAPSSFSDPTSGVQDPWYWVRKYVQGLLSLLGENPDSDILEALLRDTVYKLPETWFQESDWRARLVNALCRNWSTKNLFRAVLTGTLGDVLMLGWDHD